jgi:putative DNA primase/helicase
MRCEQTAPLNAALALAARTGWKLFPTLGKVPATSHGFKDASSDPTTLVRRFADAPGADGFAVACGMSGLAVVDTDVKTGLDGRDSLRDAGLDWTSADTVRALTPRGGEHAFFSGVVPSRIAALPGVDIKSEGGYVVLPPAPGREWIADASPLDVGLAPVPKWLIELAGAKKSGKAAPEWLEAIAGYVHEGARNNTAASIAGHLLRRKVDSKLVRLLVVAWARSFCDPPLEDREALRVVKSIAEREARS